MKKSLLTPALLTPVFGALLFSTFLGAGGAQASEASAAGQQVQSSPGSRGLDVSAGNPTVSTGGMDQDAAEDWDPFYEMSRIQEQMNRMFEHSFRRFPAASSAAAFADPLHNYEPQTDFVESDNAFVLTMDLPGMAKDKIQVEASGGMLSVSGERSSFQENKSDKDHFYQQERSFGSFRRMIPIPQNAAEEGMKAKYENGVLTVAIPKLNPKAEGPGVKKIPVS